MGVLNNEHLEKVSAVPVTARATIGAMFILAQIIASVSDQSYVQRGFSDALFHQLLQAMLHPDVRTRITAHQIFAVILVPTSVFQDLNVNHSNQSLSMTQRGHFPSPHQHFLLQLHFLKS